MPRQAWTREALIIAFNLYCKLAFGQYHRRNPKVIDRTRVIMLLFAFGIFQGVPSQEGLEDYT